MNKNVVIMAVLLFTCGVTSFSVQVSTRIAGEFWGFQKGDRSAWSQALHLPILPIGRPNVLNIVMTEDDREGMAGWAATKELTLGIVLFYLHGLLLQWWHTAFL